MGPFPGIYFPRGSTDDMIRTMEQCGYRMLVFCHHAALMAPDIGNAANVEAVRRYPDHLRAYLGVNPNYPDILDRDLAAYDRHRDVFVGLKLLAGYHATFHTIFTVATVVRNVEALLIVLLVEDPYSDLRPSILLYADRISWNGAWSGEMARR